MATIGVPIKVLHEAEGHIVTIETTTGNHRQIQIEIDKPKNGQIQVDRQVEIYKQTIKQINSYRQMKY